MSIIYLLLSSSSSSKESVKVKTKIPPIIELLLLLQQRVHQPYTIQLWKKFNQIIPKNKLNKQRK